MAKRAPLAQTQEPAAAAEHSAKAVERTVQAERLPWWSLRRRGHVVWAVHVALLAVFALLAGIVHAVRTDQLDTWVSEHLQRLTALDGLLRAVSWFGYTPQDIIVDGVILLVLFFVLRLREDALFLLGAVLGSAALNWLVKTLVARPRPGMPLVQVLQHAGSYSFPSGHVMSYVTFFGFLAAILWIRLRPSVLRTIAIAICLALIILIGPSRIYLGAHWTSDVIGAYLLGGIWLSVMLRLYVARLDRTRPG
ncbi:MAG TPA: phosphatase PAP2 family protein [Chloroflexota bacterium]|nr:phosphatase PAP2 family protein [Chloroflexota bacterium]